MKRQTIRRGQCYLNIHYDFPETGFMLFLWIFFVAFIFFIRNKFLIWLGVQVNWINFIIAFTFACFFLLSSQIQLQILKKEVKISLKSVIRLNYLDLIVIAGENYNDLCVINSNLILTKKPIRQQHAQLFY